MKKGEGMRDKSKRRKGIIFKMRSFYFYGGERGALKK